MTRQFFLPGYRDAKKAESDYLALRVFLDRQDYAPKDLRIYSIRYVHQGDEFVDTVGEPTMRGHGAIVMAVYALADGSYAICTRNRGWDMEHVPIFTGRSSTETVVEVTLFQNG